MMEYEIGIRLDAIMEKQLEQDRKLDLLLEAAGYKTKEVKEDDKKGKS